MRLPFSSTLAAKLVEEQFDVDWNLCQRWVMQVAECQQQFPARSWTWAFPSLLLLATIWAVSQGNVEKGALLFSSSEVTEFEQQQQQQN